MNYSDYWRVCSMIPAATHLDTSCNMGRLTQGVMGRIRPKMSQCVLFLTLPKVPCALRKFVPRLSLPVYEGVILGCSFKEISYSRGYDVTNTLCSIILTLLKKRGNTIFCFVCVVKKLINIIHFLSSFLT